MDRDVLRASLMARCEAAVDEAMRAVEAAPDGQWIAGSEWEVRGQFQKLMADWIATQIDHTLTYLKAMMLDFFHLSEHVFATARDCHGAPAAARAWAHARLQEIKTQGVLPVLAAIDAACQADRPPGQRESLQRLRRYIVERNDMLDYRTALARGWDIGSGPTEAMCKNLTLRLKRPGMKWDRKNAAAIMNLTALYESGQAKTYWAARRAG